MKNFKYHIVLILLCYLLVVAVTEDPLKKEDPQKLEGVSDLQNQEQQQDKERQPPQTTENSHELPPSQTLPSLTTEPEQSTEQTNSENSISLDIVPDNYTRGLEILAESYLFGHDHKIDFQSAHRLFEELSRNGSSVAQMYLGFMYAAGLGVQPSQAKAILYYTFAATGGNIFAQMALAYRYWGGISVFQNCESSLKWYRRVAKKVEEEFSFSKASIIHRIRLYDEHENPGSFSPIVDEDLIQYYQFLADKGDVQAQVGLGQLHFQGARGLEKDHSKALIYFQQAADAGNVNAMAYLGKMYMEGGTAVKQDYKKASQYFRSAAEKNNPVGLSGLGIMYLEGKGVDQDYELALSYFESAARQNWMDGQLQLGIMYYKGLGVEKDYKKAYKYFEDSSKYGHVLGFYNLAQMHATGIGTIRDCGVATELLKNVAERGNWGTRLMQAHSDLREGHSDKAFIGYAFLSELGYEVAQSNAAFILDRQEVSALFDRNQTYSRALMYWARSAAQNYPIARLKLGDHHYYGQGTKIDYEAAASHYRIASEQLKNAQAFFNLGYMHEQGLGLKRDIHLAQRYYDLAAETSNDAQVPVALVKIKLKVVYLWESINSLTFVDIITFLDYITGEDWDVYVITLLALLIAMMLCLRRVVEPQAQQPRPQQDQTRPQQQRPQPTRPPEPPQQPQPQNAQPPPEQ